jgi:hypothetical protein
MEAVKGKQSLVALIGGLLLGIAAIAVVVIARESDDQAPSARADQPPGLNRDIDSYVLFAYDSLVFKGRNSGDTGVIMGGNVGVNNVDGDPTPPS